MADIDVLGHTGDSDMEDETGDAPKSAASGAPAAGKNKRKRVRVRKPAAVAIAGEAPAGDPSVKEASRQRRVQAVHQLMQDPFLDPYLRAFLNAYYVENPDASVVRAKLEHDMKQSGSLLVKNPDALLASTDAAYESAWVAGRTRFHHSLFSRPRREWGNPEWFPAKGVRDAMRARQNALWDLIYVVKLSTGYYVHAFRNEKGDDGNPSTPGDIRCYRVIPMSALSYFNGSQSGSLKENWSLMGREYCENTVVTVQCPGSAQRVAYPHDIRHIVENLIAATLKKLPALPAAPPSSAPALASLPLPPPPPPRAPASLPPPPAPPAPVRATPPASPAKTPEPIKKRRRVGAPPSLPLTRAETAPLTPSAVHKAGSGGGGGDGVLILDFAQWSTLATARERRQHALIASRFLCGAATRRLDAMTTRGLFRFLLRASVPQQVGDALVQHAISRDTGATAGDNIAFVVHTLQQPGEEGARTYDFAAHRRGVVAPTATLPPPPAVTALLRQTIRMTPPPPKVVAPEGTSPIPARYGARFVVKRERAQGGAVPSQKPPLDLVLLCSPGLVSTVRGALAFFENGIMEYMLNRSERMSPQLRSGQLYQRLRALAIATPADVAIVPEEKLCDLLPADDDRICLVIALSFLKLFEQIVRNTRTSGGLKNVPRHALLLTYGWNDTKVRAVALARLGADNAPAADRLLHTRLTSDGAGALATAHPVPASRVPTALERQTAPLTSVYRVLVGARKPMDLKFMREFAEEHTRLLHSPFVSEETEASPLAMLRLARDFLDVFKRNTIDADVRNGPMGRLNEYQFFVILAHLVAACFLPVDEHPAPGTLSFAALFDGQ